MKKLLIIPLLSLFSAAHAVDYVKCEAMQRANDRAQSSLSATYKALFSLYSGKVKEDRCGAKPLPTGNTYKFEKFLDWLRCVQDAPNAADNDGKEIYKLIEFSPDYQSAKKRVEKIQIDYANSGCY